jgi:hypothetical protein
MRWRSAKQRRDRFENSLKRPATVAGFDGKEEKRGKLGENARLRKLS